MPLPRYSPPIERVREDYARQCAWKLMRARRGPRPPRPPIPDNSEPWIADPRTVEDLWDIAQSVQALADKWARPN